MHELIVVKEPDNNCQHYYPPDSQEISKKRNTLIWQCYKCRECLEIVRGNEYGFNNEPLPKKTVRCLKCQKPRELSGFILFSIRKRNRNKICLDCIKGYEAKLQRCSSF